MKDIILATMQRILGASSWTFRKIPVVLEYIGKASYWVASKLDWLNSRIAYKRAGKV